MIRKVVFIGLILLALAAVVYYATRFHATPIADIMQRPRDYDRKELTIQGTVTERTDVLGIRYFKVKDETGEIAVTTDRILPSAGDRVRIRGKVREAFAIGDSRLIVFEERTE